jgi:hypothetical protein
MVLYLLPLPSHLASARQATGPLSLVSGEDVGSAGTAQGRPSEGGERMSMSEKTCSVRAEFGGFTHECARPAGHDDKHSSGLYEWIDAAQWVTRPLSDPTETLALIAAAAAFARGQQEERDAVVAYLRDQWVKPRFADAIERGEHVSGRGQQ